MVFDGFENDDSLMSHDKKQWRGTKGRSRIGRAIALPHPARTRTPAPC
jgi:hypothetical protein